MYHDTIHTVFEQKITSNMKHKNFRHKIMFRALKSQIAKGGGGGCQKCTKTVQRGRGDFRIVYVHIFKHAFIQILGDF